MPRRNRNVNLEDYMGEREEKLTAFARLLLEYYRYLCDEWGVRYIPVVQFAQHLGVAQSSVSAWFSGERPASLPNAIIMAINMGPAFGPRVLRSLNYPDVPPVYDPDLKFIVARWGLFRPEAKTEVMEIAKNEDRNIKSNKSANTDGAGLNRPDGNVASSSSHDTVSHPEIIS